MSTVLFWNQFSEDPEFRYWSLSITTHDTESRRPHPLERLFLPFDRHIEHRKPQETTSIFRVFALILQGFHRRHAGVAIEAIRVRNQRPKLFWRRFEIELPAIMKFAKGHSLKQVSGFRVQVSSSRFWVLRITNQHRKLETTRNLKPET